MSESDICVVWNGGKRQVFKESDRGTEAFNKAIGKKGSEWEWFKEGDIAAEYWNPGQKPYKPIPGYIGWVDGKVHSIDNWTWNFGENHWVIELKLRGEYKYFDDINSEEAQNWKPKKLNPGYVFYHGGTLWALTEETWNNPIEEYRKIVEEAKNGQYQYFDNIFSDEAVAWKPTLGVDCWKEVMKDMETRRQFGEKKYGKLVTPNDKEDWIQHAYEEMLDFVVYAKAELMRRKNAN